MDEARATIIGSDWAQCLASDGVSAEWGDNELTSNPDDDDGEEWDFPDMPVSSHLDVCCSLCQDFNAILELFCSANVAVHEDVSSVLAWRGRTQMISRKAILQLLPKLKRWGLHQSLKKLLQRHCPAGQSRKSIWFANVTRHAPQWNVSTPTRWGFANRFLAKRLGNVSFMMLNTHLLGSKLIRIQLLGTSKPLNAILCSFLGYLLSVWSKLVREYLLFGVSEAALVNPRYAVADQSSLAINARGILDASLQSSTEVLSNAY